MLYFGCWKWLGVGARIRDTHIKPDLPQPDNQGARAFLDRGTHAETAVSSDSHLEIGHVVVGPGSS